MKNILLAFYIVFLFPFIQAQTIPFSNVALNTKGFSIDKTSPTLDINSNFIFGSNFINLKKGDAVYVTCKENKGENIEFYLREKGSKNLLAQVSENANACYFYKANKDMTMEVFGIIGKDKYMPNAKII